MGSSLVLPDFGSQQDSTDRLLFWHCPVDLEARTLPYCFFTDDVRVTHFSQDGQMLACIGELNVRDMFFATRSNRKH